MRKQVKPQNSLATDLAKMVDAGRLFALQERVLGDARPKDEAFSQFPDLLLQSVKSGFHSMVEVVLKLASWPTEDLMRALNWALHERRGDLAELILEAGAPIQEFDFEELCGTMHVPLMERFLESGGNPAKGNAFAKALSRFKARPLLRFYKEMRASYAILDDQAALALYQAVADESVRWTCLLIWAGADPFRKVPHSLDEKWDEEGYMTTAAAEACWHDDDEFLKAMKLKPTPDQAQDLCLRAAFKPTVAKFEMLLKNLSAEDLNRGEARSCEFLEELINYRRFDFGTPCRHSEEDSQRIQCIEYLLKRGAKWNPSDEGLKRARHGLSSFDGLHVASVIRLLIYMPGASEIGKIWELCRTPKMRSKILFGDDYLLDEIDQMRKRL